MDRSDIKRKTISELCKPHLILLNIREQNYHNTPVMETRENKSSSTTQLENQGESNGGKWKGLKKLFPKSWSQNDRLNLERLEFSSDCRKSSANDPGKSYNVLGSLVNLSRRPSMCETYENRRSKKTGVISSPTWLFERSHYSPTSGPISIQSEGEFCARTSAQRSACTAETACNFEDILKEFGLKRHKSCVIRPNSLRLQMLPTKKRSTEFLEEKKCTNNEMETTAESREHIQNTRLESKEHDNAENNPNKWKTLTEMKLFRKIDDESSQHLSPSPAGQTSWEEQQKKVVTIFTRTAKNRVRYGRKEFSCVREYTHTISICEDGRETTDDPFWSEIYKKSFESTLPTRLQITPHEPKVKILVIPAKRKDIRLQIVSNVNEKELLRREKRETNKNIHIIIVRIKDFGLQSVPR